MPDTKTKTTAATEGNGAKQTKVFDVSYELEIVDGELPERPGARTSVLKDQLDQVSSNEKYHGKWVRIGLYGKSTAATAARNVLQQRHGRTQAVDGWKFETRRIPGDESKTGLFAKYEADKIIAGAMEAHKAGEQARKDKLKAEREAAKASAGQVQS
jgi:hypothetical protein